jgi:hypothetical protein
VSADPAPHESKCTFRAQSTKHHTLTRGLQFTTRTQHRTTPLTDATPHYLAHNQSINQSINQSRAIIHILIPHVRRNRSMGQKPFLLQLIHISNAAAVLETSLYCSFACDLIELTTPANHVGLCSATAPTRHIPDASRRRTIHACPIILYWPHSLDRSHVFALLTTCQTSYQYDE